MNVYEYVAINEYGALLAGTENCTAQGCEYNVVGLFGQDWRSKGICICQMVPVPVAGQPAGYWLNESRKHIGPLLP